MDFSSCINSRRGSVSIYGRVLFCVWDGSTKLGSLGCRNKVHITQSTAASGFAYWIRPLSALRVNTIKHVVNNRSESMNTNQLLHRQYGEWKRLIWIFLCPESKQTACWWIRLNFPDCKRSEIYANVGRRGRKVVIFHLQKEGLWAERVLRLCCC